MAFPNGTRHRGALRHKGSEMTPRVCQPCQGDRLDLGALGLALFLTMTRTCQSSGDYCLREAYYFEPQRAAHQ